MGIHIIYYIGRVNRKSCLLICAKWADSSHPAQAQNIVRACALYSYIMWYTMILIADSECTDQAARKRTINTMMGLRIRSGPSLSAHDPKANFPLRKHAYSNI